MASLKKTLLSRGLQLMADPRVLKLMQDPRVMKALMGAVAVPGRLQSFTADQLERLVKAMDLAREDEVKNLQRTVRRLEEEVARMRRETRDSASGAPSGATRAARDSSPPSASGREPRAGAKRRS